MGRESRRNQSADKAASALAIKNENNYLQLVLHNYQLREALEPYYAKAQAAQDAREAAIAAVNTPAGPTNEGPLDVSPQGAD
jgi:hypothetical protein